MREVRAKKKLGQHFLTDLNIARNIANSINFSECKNLLEIGPGMGALTQFLVCKDRLLNLVEIDSESIAFLKKKYSNNEINLIEGNFLKLNFNKTFGSKEITIIGNFPYNISTQIVFKAIENRIQVPLFIGMFQKEVAERLCELPGTKKYGIISVLTQLFYYPKILFTVPPRVFKPIPKVVISRPWEAV